MSAPVLRPIVLPTELAGAAAPCDLFDERGNLLLRQGNPLAARMLGTEPARRVFCHAGQIAHASHHAPLRTMRDVGEALAVLEELILSGHMPPADTFVDLARQCHAAWRFDADACIGYARLSRQGSPAVAHLLLSALLAAEIGHAHGLPHTAVDNLIGAALTMNLGSIALHDRMQGQTGPLDTSTRQNLLEHPMCAASLLRGIGSIPTDWLRAVAEHHENIDGSGYPQGLQRGEIALGARILRVADVFAARLLGRDGRKPHYWNLRKAGTRTGLMEHVFGDELKLLDRHLALLLITRLSHFPPGSMVRLSNGELAVISRRTGGSAPREALSVIAPSGRLHSQPCRRPLGTKECHIQSYAHDEQLRRLPEYDWASLWGYGEALTDAAVPVH